jgi:16S rRNA processing protein RimM
MKDFIEPIATITSTSGLKGNVKLKPLSRYFDTYINKNNLFLGKSSSSLIDCLLENIKGEGKARTFKIKKYNSVKMAKKLIGMNIYVKPNEEDAINYISKDLLNFEVITDKGYKVGILKDVMWLQNNDIYVVQSNKKEFLIPVIPEFIKKVNFSDNTIIVKPVEGLFD